MISPFPFLARLLRGGFPFLCALRAVSSARRRSSLARSSCSRIANWVRNFCQRFCVVGVAGFGFAAPWRLAFLRSARYCGAISPVIAPAPCLRNGRAFLQRRARYGGRSRWRRAKRADKTGGGHIHRRRRRCQRDYQGELIRPHARSNFDLAADKKRSRVCIWIASWKSFAVAF